MANYRQMVLGRERIHSGSVSLIKKNQRLSSCTEKPLKLNLINKILRAYSIFFHFFNKMLSYKFKFYLSIITVLY